MSDSDEFIAWTFDVYEQLISAYGQIGGDYGKPAYLPVEEDFPVVIGRDQAYAERMLAHMITMIELEDVRIDIEVVIDPPRLADTLPVYNELADESIFSSACAWDDDAECFHITIAEKLLADPSKLITNLAYSLASVCVMLLPEDVEIEDEEEMFAWTEVCTVYLGFGVFLANGAVNFDQYTEGLMQRWQTSRDSILSEEQIAIAIAIQLLVAGADAKPILKELKANPRATLSRAMPEINTRWAERLAVLRDARADNDEVHRPPTSQL